MPVTNIVQTGYTNITDTTYGTDPVKVPGGPWIQKCYVTQNAASSVAVGEFVFLNVGSAVTAPFSGHFIVCEPFLTSSNVPGSAIGFMAETLSGEGWAFVQRAGWGTVLLHGSGATTSVSHGGVAALGTGLGFTAGGVGATTDAVLWARIGATGSVNGGSVATIGSASTDRITVPAYIMNNRFPFGGY